MTSQMKATLLLLTAALLAPITLLVGVAAPIAFGATTLLGISAITFNDYATPARNIYKTAKLKSARTEIHPFAA